VYAGISPADRAANRVFPKSAWHRSLCRYASFVPHPAVLTGACIVFAFALVVLGDAFLFRRVPFRPRCRACGADARGAVWREGCRCVACHASLVTRRSVRWRRARRGGWRSVFASFVALAALVTIVIDRWLASRLLMWRDLRPVSWLVLEPDADPNLSLWGRSSIYNRIRAGVLTEADAADALVRILGEPSQWRNEHFGSWARVADVAYGDESTHALIRRWLKICSKSILQVRIPSASNTIDRVELTTAQIGVKTWTGQAVLREVRGDAEIIGSARASSGSDPRTDRPWSEIVTLLRLPLGEPGDCTFTIEAHWTLAVGRGQWRQGDLYRASNGGPRLVVSDASFEGSQTPSAAIAVHVIRRYTLRGTRLADGTFQSLAVVADELLDEESDRTTPFGERVDQ